MSENSQAIIDQFNEDMDKDSGTVMTIELQGAIIGTLEKSCGGKENRQRILKMLTGHTSSKELSGAHWNALYKLVLPFKPEGGRWQAGNPNLDEACNILLLADMDQPGQTYMFPGLDKAVQTGKVEYPEFEALKKMDDGGIGEFDWTNITEEPKGNDEEYTPPF